MTKRTVAAMRAQIARETRFESCEECSDGWIPAAGDGYLHVKRCRCWYAHITAVEAKVDARLAASKEQA